MTENQILPLDQLNLLFANLDEMLCLHSKFNQSMKQLKKKNIFIEEVGSLLLDMFDGDGGQIFEKAASKYCSKQQIALRTLRDQRRRDAKLNNFLNEIEANPICKRYYSLYKYLFETKNFIKILKYTGNLYSIFLN